MPFIAVFDPPAGKSERHRNNAWRQRPSGGRGKKSSLAPSDGALVHVVGDNMKQEVKPQLATPQAQDKVPQQLSSNQMDID